MKYKELINAIVSGIETAPLHSRVVISREIIRLDTEEQYGEDRFFDIYMAVLDRLRKNGKRWLDFHEYDNMIVGLPIILTVSSATLKPNRRYLLMTTDGYN